MRRERLLARLDLATRQRLTVLIAPAGAGKTSLLAQWVETRRPARLRWFTVDPHGQPEALVGALASALVWPQGRRPATGPPATAWRTTPDETATWLRERPPTTVIIEDLHRLYDPIAVEVLQRLVDHAPKTLRLLVSTEYDLPRMFYRQRLLDDMIELRQGDLAFDREESAELLRLVTGRSPPASRVEAIWRRTEGWALGLHLAALALRDSDDPDALSFDVATTACHVAPYLTREVLDKQPPVLQRFLVTTSVLEQLHPDLCDHVLERHDSQSQLDELQRRSLFLTRSPEDGPWCRYHPLFRTMLRHRLHASDPEFERRALERAATWHLERGRIEEGVRYLRDARAWDRINEHVRGTATELFVRGDVAVLVHALTAIPEKVRDEDPDLLLLEAAVGILTGDAAGSDRALRQLEGRDLGGPAELVTSLLGALEDHRGGRTDTASERAERTQRLLDALGDAPVPNVLGLTGSVDDITAAIELIRGASALHRGELARAGRALTTVLETPTPIWDVEALGHLALLETWGGRLHQAEELVARAVMLAAEIGPGTSTFVAAAHLADGAVARNRGDLDRAWRSLERVDDDDRALGPILQDLLTAERSLLIGERELPEEGALLLAMRRRRPPLIGPRFAHARLQAAEGALLLRGGDVVSAERALGPPPDTLTEQAIVRFRTCLLRGDAAAARAVLTAWPTSVPPRATWDRHLASAILLWGDGQEQAACDAVNEVVAEAAPHHHVGVFLDLDHALRPIVAAAYDDVPSPFLRDVLEYLPRAAGHATGHLVEPLTEREQALLTLLPMRLTNAELADALDVSVNTVKTHLKHIYRKLGVAKRRDALAVAERLHLL